MQDQALQVKRRISLCLILVLMLIAVVVSFVARDDIANESSKALGSGTERVAVADLGQEDPVAVSK